MTINSISPAAPNSTRSPFIRVWDLPVRLFHWTLAISILVAFLSAEEDSLFAGWHQFAGWIAAILIAFRLIWGLIGGEHARFANFLKPRHLLHHVSGLLKGKPERSIGHNPLGGLAVVVLIWTIGAIVYTGTVMQGESGEELHEMLTNILLGLIALHVVAVVGMSVLTKDNLIKAFVTGRKRADLHPNAVDALPPTKMALPIAAATIGAASYGVLMIDPMAFTPGAHVEAGEGGESQSGEIGEGDGDND